MAAEARKREKYAINTSKVPNKTLHGPGFHGAIEQPSGRLPSDLHRPVGSRVDGTLTAASDLCMMALIAACLEKNDLGF